MDRKSVAGYHPSNCHKIQYGEVVSESTEVNS